MSLGIIFVVEEEDSDTMLFMGKVCTLVEKRLMNEYFNKKP